MKSESRLLVNLWELIVDQLPKGARNDAIFSIMRQFEEYGFELEDFSDAVDEDPYIAAAYKLLVDEPYEDEEDEED